ncbi:DUF3306 domain-containing protein [Pseudaminobacter soli (ex Li et al. 2025)]|uniref:DUF3306 domain-containing protein n=1 Tax=Pseudaminobacter soli (ex Li et al. 2025) TaxID=1295366 RepID=A0A2P7SKS8_9HYPH|nr:DUF3306 domain-containing protein [Mesorhizobium soli]PSJ63092.1 hypothetical protein C7I85_05940 [Mesorhizobium soli]
MAENEGVFTRWSRLKRRATEGSRKAGEPEPPETESAPSATDEAAADLTQLPSLDSINATTDIRGFLAAGVPKHLRNAALRRAWSADPAIRDFIGPNENFWDHSTGNVPGFKQLASYASSRLLAQALDGEPRKETGGEPVTAISEISGSAQPSQPKRSAIPDDRSETTHNTSEDAAKQQPADNRARHHGGAVPHFDQK